VTKVVLVHGLAGAARWWAPVAARLEPEHEVHAVDVPPLPALSDAAEWLAGWIEGEVGRATLVGHSRGGLVAARVAAARPELVEKLVLVAPAGGETPSTRRAHVVPLVRAVIRARPRVLTHLARDALRTGPLTLWRASGDVVAATLDDLARVEAPTLIVWGERDRLLPAERAELFRAALPAAQVAVLRGAAHVPMLEAPDELAAALRDFLG
jgi:pimeloyl-ACP methyl ester carboxylesterase